jgi:DnaJ-class molecular chaperone
MSDGHTDGFPRIHFCLNCLGVGHIVWPATGDLEVSRQVACRTCHGTGRWPPRAQPPRPDMTLEELESYNNDNQSE